MSDKDDDKLADLINWKVIQALANQTLEWSVRIDSARKEQSMVSARKVRFNWLRTFKEYEKKEEIKA